VEIVLHFTHKGQTLIDAKLETGKSGQERELIGRNPFRRRRSALDCSTIKEEEEC
jgi:hypothetical protein